MFLALFDMDGTLIDSQAHIVASMAAAFDAQGLPAPDRSAILAIVGLSLPQAMFRLAPDLDGKVREQLVEGYKQSFMKLRKEGHISPLYPGALDCLKTLSATDGIVLGIATGKSRRGVNAVFENHALAQYFETVQVADDHPSKPHPSMVQAALLETQASGGAMIGDTSFDMEMGRAGGMSSLGVTWGYHAQTTLAPISDILVDEFSDIAPAIEKLRSI